MFRDAVFSCGHSFQVDDSWVLYLHEVEDRLVVPACGRATRRVEADRLLLGPPAYERVLPPRSPEPLEVALRERDPDAVRAAIADGAEPGRPLVGGSSIRRARETCVPEVWRALLDGGVIAHLGWLLRCAPDEQRARPGAAPRPGSRTGSEQR